MANEGSDKRVTSAPSGSPDVFLSYASQDVATANATLEVLEKQGIRCWIAPRDVTPGAHYAGAIISAISGAKALVLVLSDSALASKHVGKEIERASSKGRPIIALRTGSAPLPPTFEYFLSESQWIDVGVGGVPGVAARLVEAVRSHLSLSFSGEPQARPDPSIASRGTAARRTKWILAASVGMLFLVSAYVAFNKFRPGRPIAAQSPVSGIASAADHATPTVPQRSVAVLPFLDMSETQDEGYFSDGLSEELIDMLTKVPDLRVPARTSLFYFKGKQTTIKDIAAALGVAHVLEGSVRKSGKTLRITAQLIRVDNGYRLWSKTFDRKLDDIFKVQDEIAGAVVKALKVSLLGSEVPVPSRTTTTDAYLLYFKGVALGRRDYALVSAAVRGAAEQAFKLDPRMPEAHIAVARAALFDWRWDVTDAEVKKALALQPDNPTALRYASIVPLSRGQTDVALRYVEAALLRDPLDYFNYLFISRIQTAAGRYAAAEAAYRKCYDLNPAQDGFHASIAYFRFLNGDPAAAFEEVQKEPVNQARLVGQVVYLNALGRHAEADAALSVVVKKYAQTAADSIAGIYALRGNTDLAFAWLERAYREHDPKLEDLKIDQSFRSLRADPRFKALLRKMNLAD